MMSDKASDLRPRIFFVEYAALYDYDLKPNELCVYVWIVSHINGHTGEAFPSLRTLAKEAHMSHPSVVKAVKKLEELKLIEVERSKSLDAKQHNVNHYKLCQATKEGSKQWAKTKGDGHTRDQGVVTPVTRGGHDVAHNNTESNKILVEAKNASTPLPPKNGGKAAPVSVAPSVKQKERTPAAKINPVKDAIVAAFGWDRASMTTGEWGKVSAAAKQLADVDFEADKVAALYAHCKALCKDHAFTPLMLPGHVSEWRSQKPVRHPLDGLIIRGAEGLNL